MKKKYLLFNVMILSFISFCLIASCKDKDDETPPPVEEDDITEYVELPTEDHVFRSIVSNGNGGSVTLYYYSAASASTDHSTLVDNMLRRYPNVAKWNGTSALRQGDMFMFGADEFASIAENAETLDAFKQMYGSGVIMAMEGGVESDFAKVCSALGCYNPYEGTPDAGYLPGEKPLWVFSGPLPSAEGIYMKMCPSDESIYMPSPENDNEEPDEKTGFFTDYVQGQFCDLVVDAIQNSLEPPVRTNDPQELTNLVSAYKVYFQQSQTIQAGWYNKSDMKENRTNAYQVEYDIYSCFSEDEKRTYYYIHAEIMCNFANTYIGVYLAASPMYKDCAYYGRAVYLSSRHGGDHDGVILHRTNPQTTQQITEYTSGVSFNLGGEVGTSSGASISGGVTISKSESYSVSDVTISELSNPFPQPNAAWKFDLKPATAYFHLFYYVDTGINEGSLTGRTSFHGGADFIFSMPQGHSPSWYIGFTVELELIYCDSGKVQGTGTKYASLDKWFNLPEVK